MTLGERIIRYRAEHSLTQKEFAKLARINATQVWALENGYTSYAVGKIPRMRVEMFFENEKKAQ